MIPAIPETQDQLQQLRDLIAEATAAIAPSYFLLPVADEEGGEPIVQYRDRRTREFHQLRSRFLSRPLLQADRAHL
jgi:hypothetical protein